MSRTGAPAPADAATDRLDSNARRFTFIGGAEGSGTTLLLRMLSAAPGLVSLGGNHVKLPEDPAAKPLATAFEMANRELWDRKMSFRDHAQARDRWQDAMRRILESPAFGAITGFFFKRSFPFSNPRDRYAPDMWDIADLWPGARFITIYRDPRESTYSALRRGFDNDIRRLAVICSEQLTWMAAQVRALGPERVSTVSYRALCSDPRGVLMALAPHCGLNEGDVELAVAQHRVVPADDRWSRELSSQDARELDAFFDARRLQQWDVLNPVE